MAEIVQRTMRTPASEDPARSSMLSTNVLQMLEGLARAIRGTILEVGAYTGGSIIATCSGLDRSDQRQIITIEAGGSHTSHPTMPTDDILRDLTMNLAQAGLSDRVTVIPLPAHEAYAGLAATITREKVGLLIIDADGVLGFHLPALAPFLAPGCVIVLDDYYEDRKGVTMRAYLAESVRAGAVEAFGVVGFGTWVGRLHNASTFPRMPFTHEINFAWQCRLDFAPPGDSPDETARSTVRLLEDGVELGPPHSLHHDVRYLGLGRWSHWGRMIYMSASDNTDPTLNGRTYEVDVEGHRISLTAIRPHER